MMQPAKKIPVMAFLLIFTIAGVALTRPEEEKKFKNLKVLSKDINDQELERVMFSFERQLGVTCLYCHVPAKNISPKKMDFASDEKKEKLIARQMLKMTLK